MNHATALSCRETSKEIVVSFTGSANLNTHQADAIACELQEICNRAVQSAKVLVFDLRGIEFVSSKMISVLVLLSKAAKLRSLDLRLKNLASGVLEVFKVARLDTHFRLDDDGPDLLGTDLPPPRPPDTLQGLA